MSFPATYQTFAGLEIAPEVQARSDVAKFQTSLRRARDVLGRPAGGIVRRQGTVYQGYAKKENGDVRLLPFQFSTSDQCVLEFGDDYMRILTPSGYELETDYAPSGITNADPAVVSFNGHGLSPGDDVFFSGVSGMVEINNQTARVLSTTANTFSVDLDTTQYGVFTGAAGAAAYTAPPPSPPATAPPPATPPPPAAPPSPPTGSGPAHPYCVAPETMIRMASAPEKRAGDLQVGDLVWTQHEDTLEWGAFWVEAVSTVESERWKYRIDVRELLGSPAHRIYQPIIGGWSEIQHLGAQRHDTGPVVRITVRDAHTYVANGILSHNIKQTNQNPTP